MPNGGPDCNCRCGPCPTVYTDFSTDISGGLEYRVTNGFWSVVSGYLKYSNNIQGEILYSVPVEENYGFLIEVQATVRGIGENAGGVEIYLAEGGFIRWSAEAGSTPGNGTLSLRTHKGLSAQTLFDTSAEFTLTLRITKSKIGNGVKIEALSSTGDNFIQPNAELNVRPGLPDRYEMGLYAPKTSSPETREFSGVSFKACGEWATLYSGSGDDSSSSSGIIGGTVVACDVLIPRIFSLTLAGTTDTKCCTDYYLGEYNCYYRGGVYSNGQGYGCWYWSSNERAHNYNTGFGCYLSNYYPRFEIRYWPFVAGSPDGLLRLYVYDDKGTVVSTGGTLYMYYDCIVPAANRFDLTTQPWITNYAYPLDINGGLDVDTALCVTDKAPITLVPEL